MRPIRLVLLLLAVAGFAAPSRAQSVLDTILARGTLRVGLTGDYRPFSIKDEAGHYSGMDVDAAEALAGSLGVKLEIVPTSWSMLMPDLLAHKYDVGMGGITITLDRARSAAFSSAVIRTGKTPIARCADKDRFATLESIDQKGVRVATNPGGTNEKFDRAHLHAADIVVFPSNAKIFDELVAGHADVMITDAVETRLQQKLHPELCAIHPEAPFDFAELGYMMPRDAALVAYVDLWLHDRAETGAERQATEKWLP